MHPFRFLCNSNSLHCVQGLRREIVVFPLEVPCRRSFRRTRRCNGARNIAVDKLQFFPCAIHTQSVFVLTPSRKMYTDAICLCIYYERPPLPSMFVTNDSFVCRRCLLPMVLLFIARCGGALTEVWACSIYLEHVVFSIYRPTCQVLTTNVYRTSTKYFE